MSAAPLTLASGQSGTLTGTLTATARPADGRQLFGTLLLTAEDGGIVGRADVIVGSVTAA